MKEKKFASLIIGEISYDINIDCHGNTEKNVGGAVIYSSYAEAFTGYETAVLPKAYISAEEVEKLFKENNQITVFPVFSKTSTSIQNKYFTEDKEKRECKCISQVEAYKIEDLPEINAQIYHFAGLIAGDIPEELIKFAAEKRKVKVAVDVQGFLRFNENGAMVYHDWKNKEKYLPYIDFLKTDAAEAEVLTGTTDRKEAAKLLYKWGAKEIMISHNTEILVYNGRKFYTAPITSANFSGRTGRGDTVFGSYIAERLSSDIQSSLDFSTALVSMKMEKKGPFKGNRNDVLKRIYETMKAKRKPGIYKLKARNSDNNYYIYVKTSECNFMVSCLLTGQELKNKAFPEIGENEIKNLNFLFLTDCVSSNEKLVNWLYSNDFDGKIAASKYTLKNLNFNHIRKFKVEKKCAEGTGFIKDVAVNWGKSGSGTGNVWFRFTANEVSLFFCGSYSENSDIFNCNRIVADSADIAFVNNHHSYLTDGRNKLLKGFSESIGEYYKSYTFILIPVHALAEGLEIVRVIKQKLPELKIYGSRGFIKQLEKVQKYQNSGWISYSSLPDTLEIEEVAEYGYQQGGVVFVNDPDLKTRIGRKVCKRVVRYNGIVVVPDKIKYKSYAAKLFKLGKAVSEVFPAGQTYLENQQFIQSNCFKEVIFFNN